MTDLLIQVWYSNLIDHFLGRALLAGLGVSFLSGMLGCFLVWRRQSFFGDALGHSALLGVVIGLFIGTNLTFAILLTCLVIAMILAYIPPVDRIPGDTWLAIISYGSLATGLVCMSQLPGLRVDPSSILLGDILAVSHEDLLWILALVPLVSGVFIYFRQNLLMITIHRDLAHVAGINFKATEGILMVSMAMITAVGLKTMGGLLLPALFIIPAATASRFSRSPESMIAWSIFWAIVTTLGGIILSFYLNTPTGATIVLLNVVTLLGSLCVRRS